MSIIGLERALQQYSLEPTETPFDLKSVPLDTQPLQEQKTGEAATRQPHHEGTRRTSPVTSRYFLICSSFLEYPVEKVNKNCQNTIFETSVIISL